MAQLAILRPAWLTFGKRYCFIDSAVCSICSAVVTTFALAP